MFAGNATVQKWISSAFLTAIGMVAGSCGPVLAADRAPIRIGVIAEEQSVAGSSISAAAKLAAEEINANGGVDGQMIEIVAYDNHSSAADSVRAFQRAVSEDHVNAVIASYVSEVVLALQPWASRLKTVMITPGASSDVISENVAKDYEAYKYSFHGFATGTAAGGLMCDGLKDIAVNQLKMKTAVIMAEEAAWTGPQGRAVERCLPIIGLKVLDHIRFSPDTTDFTPIFNRIEALKPDLIVPLISHVGVQPTVQWKNQQVPIAMIGWSSQATNSTFWQDTNGAAEGTVAFAIASPGAAVTPKTAPFTEAFVKKYGNYPAYCGFDAYDEVYYIAEAIHRAGSKDSDKLVTALEETDYIGAAGRIRFKPKGDPNVHSLVTGEGNFQYLMLQWQNGKQVTIWPTRIAAGQLKFPSYIKLNN